MHIQDPNASVFQDGGNPLPFKDVSVPASGMSALLSADYVTYVICPGDTLSRIAQRFGITACALADFNQISPSGPVYAGGTIRIPEKNNT